MAIDADEARSRGLAGGRGHRKVRLYASKTFSATFQSNIAAALQGLAKEVQETTLRPAAYAGARVLYDEMHLRVPRVTGELEESLYHWFDVKRSSDVKKIYMIGPNKEDAPHWYNVEFGHWRYNKIIDGRPVRSMSNKNRRVPTPGTRAPTVHDLPGALFLPVWVPPTPYVRPTWDGGIQYAMKAAKKRLSEKLSDVLQGGGS